MIDDWLLFLGAGASLAPPTRLPLFPPLAAGILNGIGWRRVTPADDSDGEALWMHPQYPSFGDPDLSAEVLFGALRRFGVDFTGALADFFADRPPNAVHAVAAAVLDAGGCVWTTNVDIAIEAASDQRGLTPTRATRAREDDGGRLLALRQAAAGTLVKLHGSADVPQTMAFTDLELMAPLAGHDVEHLAELAADRTVVLYGYAGGDADLSDLLDAVFARAAKVLWFEPFQSARDNILPAFHQRDRIDFAPTLTDSTAHNLASNADAFLRAASASGATVDDDLDRLLRDGGPPPPAPRLLLPQPPGITHARLVERFGDPADHDDAIWAARLVDARARNWHVAAGHARWRVTQSLYAGGVVARAVRSFAAHRAALAAVRPLALRDYLMTRACALLLLDGDWQRLGDFAQWAVDARGDPAGRANPSDLYYRSQARRYDLRPHEARADADAAVDGLASTAVRDAERLAGALLESGIAALYQGRFDDALARGFDLRFRRGRYAIARWRAWGAWLTAVALCHLGRPTEAAEPLDAAERRFSREGRDGPSRDVRTARLLALRVRVAQGEQRGADDDALVRAAENDRPDRKRYRDDLDLILADVDLADGDHVRARQRLDRVVSEPSSPTAEQMARLGLAEIARLQRDRRGAADAFAAVAGHVQGRGAWWLYAQAVVGLAFCEDERAEAAWPTVRAELPAAAAVDDAADLALGDPRVLWLLTL